MLAAWCITSEHTGALQGLSGFSGKTMPRACFIVNCFWLSVPVPYDSHGTRYYRQLQDFSQDLLVKNKLTWIFESSNLNSPENTDLQVLPRTWNTSPFSTVSLDLQQLKLGGRHICKLHLPWKLVCKLSISLGMGIAAFSVVPSLAQGQTQSWWNVRQWLLWGLEKGPSEGHWFWETRIGNRLRREEGANEGDS